MKGDFGEIIIESHYGAISRLKHDASPAWAITGKIDAVILHNAELPEEYRTDVIRKLSAVIFGREGQSIRYYMDDCGEGEHDWQAPEKHQVQHAIEWATGRDRLISACHAGISRSSAIAYAIAASRVGAERALVLIDPHKHWPNRLIVRHASEILGLPEMNTLMDKRLGR